eukprot:550934_1
MVDRMDLISKYKTLQSLRESYWYLEQSDGEILRKVVNLRGLTEWTKKVETEIIEEIPNFSIVELCEGYNMHTYDSGNINEECMLMIGQNVKNKYDQKEVQSICNWINITEWIHGNKNESTTIKMNIFTQMFKTDPSILFKSNVINRLIAIICDFAHNLQAIERKKYIFTSKYNIDYVLQILQLLARIASKGAVERDQLFYSRQGAIPQLGEPSGLLKSLLSICHLSQSNEILSTTLSLIAVLFKFSRYNEKFATQTSQTLAVMFGYNHIKIMKPTLKAYRNILKTSELRIIDLNVKKKMIKTVNDKLNVHTMLVYGYVRNWDVKKCYCDDSSDEIEEIKLIGIDIMEFVPAITFKNKVLQSEQPEESASNFVVIPLEITKIIRKYFNLTNNIKMQHIIEDKVKQFTQLIVHNDETIQRIALQIIYYGVVIEKGLQKLMNYGLLQHLKHTRSRNCWWVLYIVLRALEYANNDQINKFIQSELLFSSMFELINNGEKMNQYKLETQISNAIKKIIKLSEDDATCIVLDKISSFLQSNTHISEDNECFLKSLMQRI